MVKTANNSIVVGLLHHSSGLEQMLVYNINTAFAQSGISIEWGKREMIDGQLGQERAREQTRSYLNDNNVYLLFLESNLGKSGNKISTFNPQFFEQYPNQNFILFSDGVEKLMEGLANVQEVKKPVFTDTIKQALKNLDLIIDRASDVPMFSTIIKETPAKREELLRDELNNAMIDDSSDSEESDNHKIINTETVLDAIPLDPNITPDLESLEEHIGNQVKENSKSNQNKPLVNHGKSNEKSDEEGPLRDEHPAE